MIVNEISLVIQNIISIFFQLLIKQNSINNSKDGSLADFYSFMSLLSYLGRLNSYKICIIYKMWKPLQVKTESVFLMLKMDSSSGNKLREDFIINNTKISSDN